MDFLYSFWTVWLFPLEIAPSATARIVNLLPLGTLVDCFLITLSISYGISGIRNNICPACYTCIQSQKSHLMSYNFNNKYTAMGSWLYGSGLYIVLQYPQHSLGNQMSYLFPLQIIINGLFGSVTILRPPLPLKDSLFLCAITTKNDKAVEIKLVIILLHRCYFIQTILIRVTHILKRAS